MCYNNIYNKMASSLASFLLGPYVDAHNGGIDFETLKYAYKENTKFFGFSEYIKKQFDEHNINATTILQTDNEELQVYVGKTLFEIYIITACKSVRYIFDDNGKDLSETLQIFMDYNGYEISDDMAMKVLSIVDNPEQKCFEDNIHDFIVRGAILDVLKIKSSEFIKNYVDWSKVQGIYWEDIPWYEYNGDKMRYLAYMKYCSKYLKTL